MPKITALPNTTVPAATDIVPFVDVSGTPTTRKATVANLAASAAFTGQYASVFGVDGYGPEGDYTTDTAATLAALAAADSAGGGIVSFGSGIYRLTGEVVVPDNVTVVGAGVDATIIYLEDADSVLSFGTSATTGERRGTSGSFTLNGNNLATVGMYVGNGAHMRFESLSVRNCVTGIKLDNLQNSTLASIHIAGCSSIGLHVTNKTANCSFQHIGMRTGGDAGVRIDDPAAASGTTSLCSHLNFWGGVLEATTGGAGTTLGPLAMVEINQGKNISFDGVRIRGGTQTSGVVCNPTVDGNLDELTFTNCSLDVEQIGFDLNFLPAPSSIVRVTFTGRMLCRTESSLIDLTGRGQIFDLASWTSSGPRNFVGDAKAVFGTGPRNLSITGTMAYALDGTAGNFISAPDAAAFDITGDLAIAARIRLADWTPAGSTHILSKYTASGNQRSYRLFVTTSGALTLGWSEDGSAALSQTSSQALSVTDGEWLWVLAILDVDDGASNANVRFYQAAGMNLALPTNWTQVGNTRTVGATTSIFSSSAIVEVGRSNGADERVMTIGDVVVSTAGTVAAVGTGGGIAARRSFIHGDGPRHLDPYGNVWTINGSASAWTPAY